MRYLSSLFCIVSPYRFRKRRRRRRSTADKENISPGLGAGRDNQCPRSNKEAHDEAVRRNLLIYNFSRKLEDITRKSLSSCNRSLIWTIETKFRSTTRSYTGPSILTMSDWARFIKHELDDEVPLRSILDLVSGSRFISCDEVCNAIASLSFFQLHRYRKRGTYPPVSP